MNILSHKAQSKIWLFLWPDFLEGELLGQRHGLSTAKLLSERIIQMCQFWIKKQKGNNQKKFTNLCIPLITGEVSDFQICISSFLSCLYPLFFNGLFTFF